MSSAIDLHIHTTASDGSVAPSALPGLLRAAGVHTFAVTDHDAVDGAREVAGLPLEGMLYIPGVEFSCISAAGRCHLLGYGCGFGLGKLLKFTTPKTKALSIEIGMQNSGLATSLAATSFSGLAMATVPGAIFSVWHNISGAILANIFRHWEK